MFFDFTAGSCWFFLLCFVESDKFLDNLLDSEIELERDIDDGDNELGEEECNVSKLGLVSSTFINSSLPKFRDASLFTEKLFDPNESCL